MSEFLNVDQQVVYLYNKDNHPQQNVNTKKRQKLEGGWAVFQSDLLFVLHEELTSGVQESSSYPGLPLNLW